MLWPMPCRLRRLLLTKMKLLAKKELIARRRDFITYIQDHLNNMVKSFSLWGNCTWWRWNLNIYHQSNNLSGNKPAAMATTTPERNDLIGWMRKNNHAARAARTLVQFFDAACQMTTWKFQIQGFSENMNTLCIYFNRAYTSPFAAYCSVNNKGCKKEKIYKIFTPSQMHDYFQVTFSLPLPSLLLKLSLCRH